MALEEAATPAALIAKFIDNVRKEEETDDELLDILSKHILTTAPSGTAVNDAVSAIEELATKRAEVLSDGSTNND